MHFLKFPATQTVPNEIAKLKTTRKLKTIQNHKKRFSSGFIINKPPRDK